MTESRLKTVITNTTVDVKKFDLDTLYILDLDMKFDLDTLYILYLDLVWKDIRPDDTLEGD